MNELEKRIAGLSPAKQKLLLEKLKEREAQAGGDQRPAIEPSPRRTSGEPFPLSPQQERLWFLDQLDPGTTAFNMSSVLPFNDQPDADALERALAALVERHESLRTHFEKRDEEPVQVVDPPRPVKLEHYDLGALADRAARAERVRQITKHPFDLARGPLFAASLLRLGSERHALVMVMHHIVSDGWSLGVLQREARALYEAARAGRDPAAALPAPRLQYPDYADHQKRWLESEAASGQLAFWQRQLTSLPPLELPTDRPRPRVQSFRGGNVPLLFDAALTDRLRSFAEKARASLFMVVLALFEALLSRYSGQSDFAVGTFIANRNRPEIEDLIGFFVNNLVLRADLAGRPSLEEALERTRRATLDAYAHQDVPFEKLLTEFQPERDLSRSPFFQAMCVLQNVPAEASPDVARQEEAWQEETEPEEGVESAAGAGAEVRANFDLTLWLSEAPKGLRGTLHGLRGTLQYNADLFAESTVARFAAHFERLARAALDAPERPLASLSLATEEERAEILAASLGPAAAEVDFVHRRILERAEADPEAIALLDAANRRSASYGELRERSEDLARHLQSLGVGPESRVATLLTRGPEMIVGILGVLLAGGAYVPFDAAHGGRERRRQMLEDCGAKWVLTVAELEGDLPDVEGIEIVRLDSISGPGPGGADEGSQGFQPLVTPDSAAYVIYTSGSTGRPKGVVVSHGALANYAHGAAAAYELVPGDRALQFASLAFDASAEEIYPTLIAGATLVLGGGALDSTPAFLGGLEAGQVSVLNLPTAYWHALMADVGRGAAEWPSTVRLTILGGEAARRDALAAWNEHVSGVTRPASSRLVNTYGPTEATIVATRWDTSPSRAEGFGDAVPIGRAIAGGRALVLDELLTPAGPGVPGELCLGGAGLARGYLDRPALTAASFVPDPLAGRLEGVGAGERLYRSGDRVRWGTTGEIEFLSRLDRQVKVRGYRIELGEIEARLATHPGVGAAAAAVRVANTGESVLVAWLTGAADDSRADDFTAGTAPAADELRAHLAGALPSYMVPSIFVPVDEMPRTPGGKLDRRALPAPPEDDAAGIEYVEPRDETEEILAEIFATVLRRGRVGVYDDFFALGGHSLLATQLATRVREAFEIELPLIRLFEAPTVARLAAVVEEILIAELEGLSDEEAAALEAELAEEGRTAMSENGDE